MERLGCEMVAHITHSDLDGKQHHDQIGRHDDHSSAVANGTDLGILREAFTAGSGAAMTIVACLGPEAHLASQVSLPGTFTLGKGGDPELEPEVSRIFRR